MTDEDKAALLKAAEVFYRLGNVALDFLVENAPMEHVDSMKYQLVEFY